MGQEIIGKSTGWLRVVQAAALTLTMAIAMQGRAAEERAIKSRVAPVYPELAKRMKITGVVKVEAKVDADGKVLDVKTLAGNHMLSTAAEEAVRKWKFAPGDGITEVDLAINFEMGQ